MIVGLIIGIARKQWKVLKWSSLIFGGAFALLIVAAVADSGSDEPESAGTAVRVSAPLTATPKPTATPVLTFAEHKTNADTIGYRELFRNNERYGGRSFYSRGEVLQVVELGGGVYELRVDVSNPGDWDSEVIWLWNYKGQRLLEDDIIEFVGRSTGLYTYESVSFGYITIPSMEAISVKLIQ